MLGVHENYLNFDVLEVGDTKSLVLVDLSKYIESPDRPMIEVNLPGYDKYLVANVEPGRVNVFNSGTLGLNKVLLAEELIDLPDGVWTIKLMICPYKYLYSIKKVLRVSQLKQKLKGVYQSIDLGDCQKKEDKAIQDLLIRIYILIEGGLAIVNKDSKKAYENYQLANKLTDKILKNFCK